VASAQVTYELGGGEKTGPTFPAGSLKVDTEIAMRISTLIKIENSEKGLLTATTESSVPTEMGFDNSGKLQMKSLTHAVGVTWMFTKVRIIFVANGKE
jgi:hypothetical protein